MFHVSKTIGELLYKYYQEKVEFSEVRLIVPSLTKNIARELQDLLISKGIESVYLIVNKRREGENCNVLLYNEAVNKRIGSFVYLCEPGTLPLLQGSINSSGAPIKDIVFGEGWPKEKNSMDFLEWSKFIDHFTKERETPDSLNYYIQLFDKIIESFEGFDPGIKESILFEDIFDLSLPSGFTKENVLFELGFPKSSKMDDLKEYYSDLSRVSAFVSKSIKASDFHRDTLRENLDSLLEKEEILDFNANDLEQLIDNTFLSINLPTTFIFSKYLLQHRQKWEILTLDVIKKIFQVPTDQGDLGLNLKNVEIEDRNIKTVSHDCKKALIFQGEKLILEFKYKCEGLDSPRLVLKRGRNVLGSYALDQSKNEIRIPIDTNDEKFPVIRSNIKLEAVLFDNDLSTRHKTHITLGLISNLRPSIVLMDDENKDFLFRNLEPCDNTEGSDVEINVNNPLKVFCLSIFENDIKLEDHESQKFEIKEEKINNSLSGIISCITHSGHGLNPELLPDSQISIDVSSGEYCLRLRLVTMVNFDKGYSLWDEIVNKLKSKRHTQDAEQLLQNMLNLTHQKLGTKTQEQINRGKLSFEVENDLQNTSCNPILINISEEESSLLRSYRISPLNKNIKLLDEQTASRFPQILNSKAQLDNESETLLKEYEKAKSKLIKFYADQLSYNLERPLYASINLYIKEQENRIYELLGDYLSAYISILNYLKEHKTIDTYDRFVLTHLDTVVLIDQNDTIQLILINPWHPMVITSNINMYNHGIKVLKKQVEKRYGNNGINSLISILDRNEPFRWFTYFDVYRTDMNKAMCIPSNDFGWKIAFCIQNDYFKKEEYKLSLSFIKKHIGLLPQFSFSGSQSAVNNYFYQYLKAHPSIRKVWIELNDDYSPSSLYNEVYKETTTNTTFGSLSGLLPGGIHFIFSSNKFIQLDEEIDYDESNPIFFYEGKPDNILIDIKILPPYDKLIISSGEAGIIRGDKENIIFKDPIYDIVKGPDNLPVSKMYENDFVPKEETISWENLFKKVTSLHSTFTNHSALNINLNLPANELGSTWTIVPSTSIDPQIIHQALKHTYQDGALWDYKLRFDTSLNSYYILSKIPLSIVQGILSSGFYNGKNKEDIISIINNISQSGISIGHEAITSTNKLHGIVGLIGAISSFTSLNQLVFKNDKTHLGFLISVESFRSVLNPYDSKEEGPFMLGDESTAKYSDLIAIQLKFDKGNLIISFSSIESKYSTDRITQKRLNHGMNQARVTAESFKALIIAASEDEGILERLAFKAIISYGIRNNENLSKEAWGNIIRNILNGNIKYCESKYPQIIFCTSKIVEDKKSEPYSGKLLQVNLNTTNWPNDNFDSEILKDLFDCVDPEVRNEQEIRDEKTVNQFPKVISNSKEVEPIPREKGTSKGPESNTRQKLAIGKISKEEREKIIDNIYLFLRSHKIDVANCPLTEVKFIEAPSYYKFELKAGIKFDFSKVESKERELAYQLALPSGFKPRLYQDRGIVWLEIPKDENQKVFINTKDYLWPNFEKTNDFRIPFGVDNDGSIVSINLSSSKSPHILIAGKTGSGKSVLLETIIRGVTHLYTENELELYMIDPKGNELIGFQKLPHCKKYNGETTDQAIDLLTLAVEEMGKRYDKFKEVFFTLGKSAKDIGEYNDLMDEKMPRWLIILDEYADLVEIKTDKRKEIESLMKRLSSKARAAGIHLIVATQRPSADVINSTVKANLPGKIALSVDSAINSRIILDEPGAEALSGKGDALFKGDLSGGLIRVQCALYKSK